MAFTWQNGAAGGTALSAANLTTAFGEKADKDSLIVNVLTHGADPTGTTDNASAFSAALTAAGAGAIFVPGGNYRLGSTVTVPADADIIGEGKKASIITCTAAGAGIQFGTFAAQGRGSRSGGFTIDGNNVATAPLKHHRVAHELFDMRVINSAGDGFTVYGAQNNKYDVEVTDATLSCIVVDAGAGQNRFLSDATRAGRYVVEIRQSVDTSGSSLYYAEPAQNVFLGGVYERLGTGGLGIVYHGAGINNSFIGCGISINNDTTGKPAVTTDVAGGFSTFSQRLRFHGCVLSGNVTQSTAFSMNGGGSVVLSGNTELRTFLRAFFMEDTDVIEVSDRVVFNNVTTRFVTNGGSLSEDTLVRERLVHPVQIARPNTSDSAIDLLGGSDTAARIRLRPDSLLLGDGTSTANLDVALSRQAANVLLLGTNDALNIGASAGSGGSYIQFIEQSPDPGAPGANGARLFCKDNGAGKTQLVVRFPTGATQVIATEP